MKKIVLFSFLVFSFFATSSDEVQVPISSLMNGIEISDEWTEYTTIDGVKIEYKMALCSGKKMRAQNLLLFKFTNTTNKALSISWVTKEFRNSECWNCEQLYDGDFSHTLELDAAEIIEGDGTNKDNKETYIFGNFIKLVPGMTEQTLTNFELMDLIVR